MKRHVKFIGFLLVQKLFNAGFWSLLPLYLIDTHMAVEYVATVTGTLPLIMGTVGSAVGGLRDVVFLSVLQGTDIDFSRF